MSHQSDTVSIPAAFPLCGEIAWAQVLCKQKPRSEWHLTSCSQSHLTLWLHSHLCLATAGCPLDSPDLQHPVGFMRVYQVMCVKLQSYNLSSKRKRPLSLLRASYRSKPHGYSVARGSVWGQEVAWGQSGWRGSSRPHGCPAQQRLGAGTLRHLREHFVSPES